MVVHLYAANLKSRTVGRQWPALWSGQTLYQSNDPQPHRPHRLSFGFMHFPLQMFYDVLLNKNLRVDPLTPMSYSLTRLLEQNCGSQP